ncbi:MAG: mechanosensitive ion channel family protein [Proteobacteria bacterium]|nr:mechanosensitive ion channel family protein [Pseudomonadota bacterium]
MEQFLENTPLIHLLQTAGILILALVLAKVAQALIVRLFRSQRLFHSSLITDVIVHIRRPLLWLLILIALYAAFPLTHIPAKATAHLHVALKPFSVLVLGWLFISFTKGLGKWLALNSPAKQARDSVDARRFNTQIVVLMRVAIFVISALTLIGMALMIPSLREFGMSLFASAGVAGIIIGVAAKETLSNLISGVQLALSQQILLGDEVVVSGQSGVIEEITSSYVVIRAWDMRRLIVPLQYFSQNHFENWTYHEADLMGTVFFYLDPMVDIDAVRAEVTKITKASPVWDGKRCDLLVTDCKENSIELRIALSARNSSDLFTLRCEVREKMLRYFQKEQTDAFPKSHVVLAGNTAA